jgi:hypothetical protein
MWSPVGYVSWRDATAGLADIVARILHRAIILKHPNLDGDTDYISRWSAEVVLVRSGLSKTKEEASLTLGISTAWIVTNFLYHFPPVAVNLTGDKVDLASFFFEHIDQLDLCRFAWPLDKASEYRSFYDHHRENGFSAGDLFERFAFLNFETGSLKVRNGTRHFLIEGAGLEEGQADEAIALVRKLRDFVLCWPENIDKADFRSFLEIMEVSDEIAAAINEMYGRSATEDSSSKAGPGRPSKVAAVQAFIAQLPPQEAAGMTHKQLARLMMERVGMDASPKTIARARALSRAAR